MTTCDSSHRYGKNRYQHLGDDLVKQKTKLSKLLGNTGVMPYDVDAFLASSDKEAWCRVAEAIVIRRSQLDMPQAQLTQETGLSVQTISRLEKAYNAQVIRNGDKKKARIRRATAYAIDHVLGWELGSIEQLLYDDKEPVLSDAGVDLLRETQEMREMKNRVETLENEMKQLRDKVDDFFVAIRKML